MTQTSLKDLSIADLYALMQEYRTDEERLGFKRDPAAMIRGLEIRREWLIRIDNIKEFDEGNNGG